MDVDVSYPPLMLPLTGALRALPEDSRSRLEAELGDVEAATVAPHVPALVARGVLDLPAAFVSTLRNHLPVIGEMSRFIDAIRQPDKAAFFPDARVAAQLPG